MRMASRANSIASLIAGSGVRSYARASWFGIAMTEPGASSDGISSARIPVTNRDECACFCTKTNASLTSALIVSTAASRVARGGIHGAPFGSSS